MLTSVMPGLRELRAPLAAGYIWLVWAWVVFADAIPSKEEVTEPLNRVYALEPVVSDLGRAVVASVAAYIVASIVIDVQGELPSWLGRPTSFAVTDAGGRVLDSLFPRSKAPSRENLLRAKRRLSGRGHLPLRQSRHYRIYYSSDPANRPPPDNGTLAVLEQFHGNQRRNRAVSAWIQSNREVAKTRLLDFSEPLHSAVDRPDAEATFRMALWPPLVALAIYLAVTVSWWWIAALVLPAMLAWQWISLRKRANDALVTAIAARSELSEPFVDAVQASVESQRNADREGAHAEFDPRLTAAEVRDD